VATELDASFNDNHMLISTVTGLPTHGETISFSLASVPHQYRHVYIQVNQGVVGEKWSWENLSRVTVP
jgi:hypothetical protein